MRRRYRSYAPGSRYSVAASWLLVMVFMCCAFLIVAAIYGAAEFQHGF